MSGEGGARTFEATIEAGRGGGAFVAIPFSVEEAYGTRGRVPVRATFDGHEYRGSIAPMGGRHLLGVVKDIRTALGKDVGDTVSVTVERDEVERSVDVPVELVTVLGQDAEAKAIFDELSYTRRKEFARWVGSARKEETRRRRAEKAPDMLRSGEGP